MQARLARSAYDALNIPAGDVSPEQVRVAFMQLAKTFHPAKFARMSTELQKLANEVFLGLRAAHDQLARPKSAATRPSGPLPAIGTRPELPRVPLGSSRQPTPAPRPAVAARTNVPPAPSAALDPATQRGVAPGPTATADRSGAMPRIGVGGQARPPLARPTGPRAPTPARGIGVQPPGRPAVTQPTPAGGMPAAKPAAAAPANVEPELVGVYDLMAKGQWDAARTTLNALIALQDKPRYRALIQYAIGREAQLANRLNEARVDLQSALAIDPDLQVAKTALAELFSRRR